MERLRPSDQPSFCISAWKAVSHPFTSGSLSESVVRKPMRRTRSGCCARAASGHAAAAPPRRVMKSRRFTASASRASDGKDSTPQLRQETTALRDFGLADDGFGSEAALMQSLGLGLL